MVSSIPFRPPTPTEVTNISTEPSLSVPSANTTPIKNPSAGKTKLEKDDVGCTKVFFTVKENETPVNICDTSCRLRWLDKDRYIHFVSVSSDIVERLRNSYAYSSDSFVLYLRNYVKRKYLIAEMCEFPFTLPISFYALCREVMGVSHELLSGALYYSGLLSFYCSEDTEDAVSGSKGSSFRNENVMESGTGILQLDEESFLSTFKKMERKMISSKPYCRFFMFPVENEERMFSMLNDDTFLGELVCLIPGRYVKHLRHQLDVFREGCCFHDDEEFVPSAKYAFVIWMNEAYRVAHPPPQDVEECFTYWALGTFKDNEVLDYDALYRCFPPRTRRLVYKEKTLQEVVKW